MFSKNLLNLRLPSSKRRMLNSKEVPVAFTVPSGHFIQSAGQENPICLLEH